MSSSTTARASDTTVDRRWMSVVFMQGDDADIVLGMIGSKGPDAAIHHLSQWDYGDDTRDAALENGYVYDEIPQSPTDHVMRGDGYALTYNHHFGYVSLLRRFEPVVEDAQEPVAPPGRFGFERQRTVRRANGLRL